MNQTISENLFWSDKSYMDYIDKKDEDDIRSSLSRTAPCFVLSDKSIIEQIRYSQNSDNTDEIIFSTSKVIKGSGLNVEACTDSVFFDDICDSDISDIEGNDDEESCQFKTFSSIFSPNVGKSYSLPHQRISTPRKRKSSSLRTDVEKKLCSLLEKEEEVDDDDIEENYLDTVWSSKSQNVFPYCGVILKHEKLLNSPICPHDDYYLNEEIPPNSVESNKTQIKKLSTKEPKLTSVSHHNDPYNDLKNQDKVLQSDSMNHADVNIYEKLPNDAVSHPTSYHDIYQHNNQHTTSFSNVPLIGIDHDYRHIKTQLQSDTPTYRDTLLKGLDANKRQRSQLSDKLKTTSNTHANSSYLPEVFHKNSDGSSVDNKVNHFVESDIGVKNKLLEDEWYTSESGKISQNGVIGKEKSNMSNQELKESKKDTCQEKKEEAKKSKLNSKRDQLNTKKEEFLQKDSKSIKNKEQLKKDSHKKVQSNMDQDIKHLETNDSLPNKIKKSKANLPIKQTKFHYLSSDDEGIYTSPYASPTGSISPQPPRNIKKHKKSKKSASGSEGDSVDGFHKRSTDDEDWKKPSSNFDEILWRPALSMGIIIITGIFIFCFKDKFHFMLSSKFPFQKSSI